MVETNKNTDAEANIGIYQVSDLADEMGKYMDDIRNRVDFNLESRILFDGKTIDQDQMVTEVDRLLTDKAGKPRLIFEGGKPFRPASTKHYTFNAALEPPD